jgi:hypothetical protein
VLAAGEEDAGAVEVAAAKERRESEAEPSPPELPDGVLSLVCSFYAAAASAAAEEGGGFSGDLEGRRGGDDGDVRQLIAACGSRRLLDAAGAAVRRARLRPTAGAAEVDLRSLVRAASAVHALRHIEVLDLSDSTYQHLEGLDALAALPRLRRLDLSSRGTSGWSGSIWLRPRVELGALLSAAPGVRDLDLSGTCVSISGSSETLLLPPGLTRLHMRNCTVAPDGDALGRLRVRQGCGGSGLVDLSVAWLTSAAAAATAAQPTVGGGWGAGVANGVAQLLRNCGVGTLRMLDISGRYTIADGGGWTAAAADATAALAPLRGALEELHIRGTTWLGSLRTAFSGLTALRSLDMRHTETPLACLDLPARASLRELDLLSCNIDAVDLRALRGLSALTALTAFLNWRDLRAKEADALAPLLVVDGGGKGPGGLLRLHTNVQVLAPLARAVAARRRRLGSAEAEGQEPPPPPPPQPPQQQEVTLEVLHLCCWTIGARGRMQQHAAAIESGWPSLGVGEFVRLRDLKLTGYLMLAEGRHTEWQRMARSLPAGLRVLALEDWQLGGGGGGAARGLSSLAEHPPDWDSLSIRLQHERALRLDMSAFTGARRRKFDVAVQHHARSVYSTVTVRRVRVAAATHCRDCGAADQV